MNLHNALGALFIAAGAVCLPIALNHHDAPPAPPSHSHLWAEQAPAADVHLDVPDPLAAAEADAAAQHAYVRLPKVELPSGNAGGSVTVPKASKPAAEKAPKAAKQSAKAKAPKSAKSSSAKAPKAQKAPAQPKGPVTTVTDKTVTGPKGTTTTHTVMTRGPAGTVGSAGSTKSS